MRNYIVSGVLGLVDAAIVKFLRGLHDRYGLVCAVPREAAFAPAVGLTELCYVLSQLRYVKCVATSMAELPSGLRVVESPRELVERSRQALTTPVTDDDEPPETWTVEELLSARPEPLVLLTGCFDLIHAGHVSVIEFAARYGAEPVVGILSTRGIRVQPKNIAGDRPFWTMADRVELLQALRSRPRVLLFDGPDSLALIEQLRPDYWIKEERDRGRAIVEQEARLATRLGAQVVWFEDARFNQSSTDIARAILNRSHALSMI